MPERAILLFAADSSAELAEHIGHGHVWMIASDANDVAAREWWQRMSRDEACGLATLQPASLNDVLELVDDHHKREDHEPAVTELDVRGLALDDEARRTLAEHRYERVTPLADGFIAQRL